MTVPIGQVAGLLPPGRDRIAAVDLVPGQVWSVGRRDQRFLAADRERAGWHLGVPDAQPDMSVNQLELRVGSIAVAVASSRGASITVDGVIRPSPAVLTHGTSHVSPSASGLHAGFSVTVHQGDSFASRDGALAASGTTIVPRLEVEPGSALSRVAHALAWPCTSAVRRPHSVGWSGRDVADRMAQLGWSTGVPGPKATTALSQQLHSLAEKVATARLSDGRPAEAVFVPWPPWLSDDDVDETRDQRAERRNRCVAETLWRAGAVQAAIIDHAR